MKFEGDHKMNAAHQIAQRLRTIREELFGLNGVEPLAAAIQIPAQTWRNYERGVTMPGDVLLRFLVRFCVSPDWLYTGEGDHLTVAPPSVRAR